MRTRLDRRDRVGPFDVEGLLHLPVAGRGTGSCRVRPGKGGSAGLVEHLEAGRGGHFDIAVEAARSPTMSGRCRRRRWRGLARTVAHVLEFMPYAFGCAHA